MKTTRYFTWRDLFATIAEEKLDENVIVQMLDDEGNKTFFQAEMLNPAGINDAGVDGSSRVIVIYENQDYLKQN